MKLTQISIVLAALLSMTAAQGLNDLPDCSKDCATNAIPAKCGIDVKCICTTKSFLNDISCCVADKCSKADQEKTLKAAKSICARGNVHDLPDSVECSKTSSSMATETSSGSTSATDSSASTTGSSSAPSAAATTGGAALGQAKDGSLVAAAGAAAFAILV
ncbi:Extracellular membrane protein CFEM domain [Penicillium alfredii]|uniref:Extracellular membrane protein CFEM domain n=1 Tax=Penicillium alfredii TaxID=1506179 RepID=A0A9W9JWS9_9EURO|nr:Extracellular membrane protein CFEM domain [Penicillium alfredii]KAJ5084360.1 Extracellular membrane protein CFEM domain [Penicillium alfredii]